jgi:cellulose synthase/poly-beta-1,6-N-acetylglucosamine synthase-like glycosyltransferase
VIAFLAVLVWLIHAYPYVFYRLVLARLARGLTPPPSVSPEPVAVSHIVCAADEEAVIERKLADSLDNAWGHPFELILVLDGPADGTPELAAEFARGRPEIRILRVEPGGKTAGQNLAAAGARGEILVFSDADTFLEPDTIPEMVGQIQGGSACVGATLAYDAPESPDGVYTGAQNRIRALESRLGMALGVNGACFAVRARDFVCLDPGVLSDLALPLEILFRGRPVTVAAEARVTTLTKEAGLGAAVRRRSRTFCRALVTVLRKGYLARSAARPSLLFHLVTGKLLRYFLGPLTVLALALTIAAGPEMLGFMVGLGLVLLGAVLISGSSDFPCFRRRMAGALRFVLITHLASFAAIFAFIAGKEYTRWRGPSESSRPERQAGGPGRPGITADGRRPCGSGAEPGRIPPEAESSEETKERNGGS